jgi:hypothetical protein
MNPKNRTRVKFDFRNFNSVFPGRLPELSLPIFPGRLPGLSFKKQRISRETPWTYLSRKTAYFQGGSLDFRRVSSSVAIERINDTFYFPYFPLIYLFNLSVPSI